jgi:hypothetical protein
MSYVLRWCWEEGRAEGSPCGSVPSLLETGYQPDLIVGTSIVVENAVGLVTEEPL